MRIEDFIVGGVALIAVVVWVAVAIAEHIDAKKKDEKGESKEKKE